jgi:hypothetical protein
VRKLWYSCDGMPIWIYLNGQFKQLEHLENNILKIHWKQRKHLYPSLMSLKILVHKLGSSNVIVPSKLLNTHHHEHKQVISK